MRIDLLLCRLRFFKSRSLAQRMIAQGHVRRNRVRVTRADQAIFAGDVLTLPLGASVKVIEILALPIRRGPAAEAQSCYRELDAGASIAVADIIRRPLVDQFEGNTHT
ncbi:S4 domain-containing protein [Alteraurantiacibacter aestuarii]|uniref:RNA-binding S4 domain-containing protein n=1 Tax=Alteraurantiacibacter aestuarii TaxID=650004 RepID=A0A844ZSP9_9SPHN|nr:S4 domain-containing protein [Alteraurantiacibacter aestuarii]MXO88619.1 RNA-binding S4 domain-containing protein [Alteraurantiacibacter aestuarii]